MTRLRCEKRPPPCLSEALRGKKVRVPFSTLAHSRYRCRCLRFSLLLSFSLACRSDQMGNPIYGTRTPALLFQRREKSREKGLRALRGDEKKIQLSSTVSRVLIRMLRPSLSPPPLARTDTPPESPVHEEQMTTIRARLPPRPPSAATAASVAAAAAAAAATTVAAVSRRSIAHVDSCGNLLDPGLVAFAEVSFERVIMGPL